MKKRMFTIGLLALPLLAGCHELTIESTFNTDGSGVRSMTLVAQEDPSDSSVTLDEYRALMNLNSGPWSYEMAKKEENGNEKFIHTFHRESKPRDIEDWAQQSGDVHIIGSVTEKEYADITFRNAIEVSKGVGPDRRTITYRERFYWTGLVEALVDYQLEEFRGPLMRTYPRLQPESVGEIFGFTKATFWSAVDQGVLGMGQTQREETFARLANRVKEHAMRVVRRQDPNAQDAFFDDFARRVFFDRDDVDDAFFESHALGALLASGLDIVVKLNLPGSVVETNAQKREGTTLVWQFTGEDALDGAVELYARAEVPREGS